MEHFIHRAFLLVALLATSQLLERQANAIAIEDGLIHYWLMDEVAGSSVTDSFGGPALELQNGAQLNVTGISGRGVLLDGENDFLLGTPFSLDFLNSDFTVSLWMRWSSAAGKPGILDFGSMAIDLSFADIKPSLHVREPTFRISATSSHTIADGRWHLLSIVRQNDSELMYLDDSVVGSGVGSLSPSTSSGTFSLGKYGNTHFFGGIVDEMAIYNRALTAAEIRANAIPEPSTFGLLAVLATLSGTSWRRRR